MGQDMLALSDTALASLSRKQMPYRRVLPFMPSWYPFPFICRSPSSAPARMSSSGFALLNSTTMFGRRPEFLSMIRSAQPFPASSDG